MPKANSSTNHADSSSSARKYHKKDNVDDGESSVGLQKLKASLRSANRLLRKADLDAQTRIDTERRVAALEKDVEEAKSVLKERELTTRYRMVKFFDRKKVCRRLAQISKQLNNSELEPQARRALEKDQFEQRVNLNYILHYPKLDKYIALFPASKDEDDAKGSEDSTSPTDSKRELLRSSIKEQMERNELSSQPELTLDSNETRKKRESSTSKPKAASSKQKQNVVGVEDDDFFEDD